MAELGIDFTAKDYDALLSQADSFLTSILPEWTGRDDNDINWATIKAVAFLVSTGMFYIDLGVNEQDPFEVQIYENALRLAKKFGMPVKKYTGATVDLEITITAQGSEYIIPRGTSFSVGGAQSYILLDDLVYPVGVTVKAGNFQYGLFERYQLALSDGEEFQKYEIIRDNVQSMRVRIFIKEAASFEEWNIEDTLLMSYETDKDCRMVLNELEKYEIHFGDNKSGKIPVNTAEIEIEVIKMPLGYTELNFGNIPVDNIDTCDDSGIAAVITSISQSIAASGGGDKETIAGISRNLPQWISTANRVISSEDARYLARRVSGVAEASIIVSGSTFYVYITPVGGGVPTITLRNAVEAYLDKRRSPWLGIIVGSATTINVVVSITLHVLNNFEQATVKSAVDTIISDYLNSSDNVGQIIKLMTVYALIDKVEGIDTASVTAMYIDTVGSGLGDIVLSASENSAKSAVDIIATGGIV